MLFSDPERVIESAGIVPGLIVADFGAGSGRYVLAVARALAATGRVYAVDMQSELLGKIAQDARKENLSNVDVICGDVQAREGSHIATGCIDLVILSHMLFQVSDPQAVCAEAKRVLKSGARMLITDWADSFGGIGPDRIVSAADALALAEKNGFSKQSEFNAGSHQYGMIFKKL